MWKYQDMSCSFSYLPQRTLEIYFRHKATVTTQKSWWEKQLYSRSAPKIAHHGNERACGGLTPTLQSARWAGRLIAEWFLFLRSSGCAPALNWKTLGDLASAVVSTGRKNVSVMFYSSWNTCALCSKQRSVHAKVAKWAGKNNVIWYLCRTYSLDCRKYLMYRN